MNAPTPAAMLQATLTLAKDLSLDLSEEVIGGRFLKVLQDLLPDRALCVRVVDGQRHEVTSLFFTAPHAGPGPGPGKDKDKDKDEGAGEAAADPGAAPRLVEDPARAPLRIKRAALRHTGLLSDIATSARVQLTDRYVPLFDNTAHGFSVPLVAGGELLGLLNCEYPLWARERAEGMRKKDEAAIIPLCNQLSVGLHNLRLLHRARSYEGYLRRMIDAANALVVVADRRGRLTIVNRPMELVSGYQAGDDLAALMAREAQLGPAGAALPRLAALLQQALMGQDSDGVEVLLQRPEGPPSRAVFNVTALKDAGAAIEGAAAMGQDLERVRSLERQVLQAERLATLGQLAAGVVHELNNPLSSIVSYGDYLARRLSSAGPEFSADAERARRICEGAERIQKLTRDLMTYGRPAGEMERLQVNEVARQALSFCDHVIKGSGARLRISLAEDLPEVMGVRQQLQQVIVNLVTNACHALLPQQGKDQISVRTGAASLSGGPAVMLSVSDTGAGIAEAHRARVFEPFFSTKAEGLGTGLGLPIVKNIVDGHGGQISFETTTGRGTSFVVLLPAAARAG